MTKELDIFDLASPQGEKILKKMVKEELPLILEKREKYGSYSTEIITNMVLANISLNHTNRNLKIA